jgi:2-polyprenyl-3-methyl-5-hydroxy-6-metoxy-1,4-benzoquinol methylase
MFELLDAERFPAHYQTLETRKVKQLFEHWKAGSAAPVSVLDYGMGHGKYLRMFRELGLQATGVDINPQYIEQAKTAGFEALHEAELEALGKRFDVIFLSHLIEHLDPNQLLHLLDRLIALLAPQGRLVMISPVRALLPRFLSRAPLLPTKHPACVRPVQFAAVVRRA